MCPYVNAIGDERLYVHRYVRVCAGEGADALGR